MKAVAPVLVIVCTLALSARAEDAKVPLQVVRAVLEMHDQSGVAGKEIVTGTATFPAGESVGFHTHPGDESGYVIKGSIVLRTQGQPDRPVAIGESFFNPRGVVHSVIAGADGATVLSTWIVDKNAALATPVP